ncbi:MAG: glycosyltransferase, partial [Chloroflexi bacterium]|nr:glycosyltransferase [Chloroflexota bacterium]
MSSPGQTVHTTLIIPAHNEEARLATTLHRYSVALRERCGPAFEIVVVANGCEDATADVARRMALKFPQIRVLEIDARIGKGGAILAGFDAAEAPDVAFVDAD